MPGRRNPRIRTLLLEASGPQEAEEEYAKRKRLSNTKAPRDPPGPLPQLPSPPAPHLKGSHVDQPPPNPIKFIRFGGGLPVEGGRPSIRRDRTQCTRGPRGTRRCPRVYPGTLGVYPGTLGVYPGTLGFTRGRSGIPGDARGIPGDARVYPGTLGYTRGRSGIPGDALCPRVCPGTIGFTRGRSGIPGDPCVDPGTLGVYPGTLGYTRGRSDLPGDHGVYPGTPGYTRGPPTYAMQERNPAFLGRGRADSGLPGPALAGPRAGGSKKAHRSAKHTLCFAIVPPGRKSVFRAGFRPDSDRESLKIGTPAGRRPAGHKYCLVFV